MNRKVSSLELEAFRAYKDKTSFDFTVDNKIANLVLIYAPNGSGKTTIFDAIEWGMTGEISRITKNTQVNEIAEKDKGHILKNTDSELNSGRVKITLSNQDYLEANTKKLDGRQKTDYRVGDIRESGIFEDDSQKKAFIEKNILKHHQIDDFLRFQNSKERYRALSIFWDYNQESEKYSSLIYLIIEVEKYKKKLEKKVIKTEEELAKMSLSPAILNSLKESIIEYNRIEKQGKLLLKEEDLEALFSICSKVKSEKEIIYLKQKSYIDELYDFYSQYKKSYKILENKLFDIEKKRVPEVQILLQNYIKAENLFEIKKELENKFLKLDNKINDVEFLEKNKEGYLKIEESVRNLEKLISESVIEKSKIDKLNLEIIDRLKHSNEEVLEVQKIEKKVSEDLQKLKTISDLFEIEETLKKNNSKLLNLQKTIEKNNIEVINREKRINNLKQLQNINVENFVDAPFYLQELSEEIISNYSYISELLKLKKTTNQDLKICENEISRNKRIGDDINKIKKLGAELINKNRLGNCPVCNKEYESYEVLVNQLNKDLNDNGVMGDLLSKSNLLKQQIDKYNYDIQIYMNKIEQIASGNMDLISKEIQDIYLVNKNYIRDYEKLEQENLKILNYKDNINYHINEYGWVNITLEKLKDNLQEEENKLKKDFDNTLIRKKYIEEKLQLENKEIKELEFNLLKQNRSIEFYRNEINNLFNDSMYMKYKHLITVENYSTEDREIKNLYNQKSSLFKEINEVQNQITTLELNLNKIDKSKIISEYEELKLRSNDITKQLNELNLNCKKYFKKDSFTEEEYTELIGRLKRNLIENEKQLEILIFIMDSIRNFLGNDLRKEKQLLLDNIKSDLTKVIEKLKGLHILQEKAYSHINNKISKVFNEVSINKIFQMVNPLREESNISFKIEETNDGLLGMDVIYSKANMKIDGQSPVLYLSSAQVNILSLSIFLASAIEHTDYISTILMDDPLQHLDGLNVLSFIDLIRIIAFSLDIQIIISTHDQSFFNLCQRKLDSRYYSAKYIDLSPKA